MAKFKGTKEEVTRNQTNFIQLGEYYISFSQSSSDKEECIAHTDLFTDALHTIQQCDLMPSELWKEWQESTEREVRWMQRKNELDEENSHLKKVLSNAMYQLMRLNVTYSPESGATNAIMIEIERVLKGKQAN